MTTSSNAKESYKLWKDTSKAIVLSFSIIA